MQYTKCNGTWIKTNQYVCAAADVKYYYGKEKNATAFS